MNIAALFFLVVLFLYPYPCSSRTLDFGEVTEKALLNSHDIVISRRSIGISRAFFRSSSSLLYPVIRAQGGVRYLKDLTDNPSGSVILGDTIMPRGGAKTYLGFFSLTGTYTLFDFRAAAKRVSIAHNDIGVKKAVHSQTIRDVKLHVLDIYTALLAASRECEIKRQLLVLSNELLDAKRRLHTAGVIAKDEVTGAEIRVAHTLRDIDTLTGNIKMLFIDLGFYTGEVYKEAIKIKDLDEPIEIPDLDIHTTPESQLYALEIKKREAEMSAIRREIFPRIDLISSYSSYGSRRELEGIAGSMRPRDVSLGVTVTMTIFDGLRSSAEMDRVREETKKLTSERNRKHAELRKEYEKLKIMDQTRASAIEHERKILEKTEELLAGARCLETHGLIARTDLIHRRMELLNKKLEITRSLITRAAVRNKMVILGTGG